MERRQSSSGNQKHAKSPSASNTNINAGININASGSSGGGCADNKNTMPLPPCMVREQDQYMPIANVIRIMRRVLPAHAKISDDAKETLQECVSEYISFITGEANERCQREQRKTITAEDVLWAMGKLGFDDYIEPLTLYLNRYRENEGESRSSVRGDNVLKRSSADYGPAGGSGPVGESGPLGPSGSLGIGFPAMMGPYQSALFDPAVMAAYFKDEAEARGGSSSSQDGATNFDPFAQFK